MRLVFEITPAPARNFVIIPEHVANGKEVATVPFQMTVQLTDEFGNLQDEFNHPIQLAFTTDAADSPTGFKPKTAGVVDDQDGTVAAATFVNGVWTSGAGDFQFVNAQSVTVTLNSDVTSVTYPGEVHTSGIQQQQRLIVVGQGPAATVQIRAAQSAVGSLIDAAWVANPANKISTVGQYFFFAAQADAVGNYIDKIAQVTWSRSPTPCRPRSRPEAGDNSIAIYDPNTVGTGKLRVDATSGPLVGQFAETVDITVEQDPAQSFVLKPWDNGGTIASAHRGDAFDLRFEAVDTEGSVDANFTGSKTIFVKVLTPAPRRRRTQPPTKRSGLRPRFSAASARTSSSRTRLRARIGFSYDITFTAGIGYLKDITLLQRPGPDLLPRLRRRPALRRQPGADDWRAVRTESAVRRPVRQVLVRLRQQRQDCGRQRPAADLRVWRRHLR